MPAAAVQSPKVVNRILWAVVVVLGAVSFAVVALTRGEPVNAAWLVIAAVCIYFIAYRFYALFIARRALGVDPTRATPAYRHNDGLDYVPTNRYVLLRPPLRGDRRRRAAGRAGAGGADGLSAGHVVDPRRRRVRRRGPGHDRAVLLDPARRQVARRHDPLRDGAGRRAPSPASACCSSASSCSPCSPLSSSRR